MARDALFDLAVNRALRYAEKLSIDLHNKNLKTELEPWYKTTRFAYRIPLENIVKTLASYEAEHYWQGGEKGSWRKGKNPAP